MRLESNLLLSDTSTDFGEQQRIDKLLKDKDLEIQNLILDVEGLSGESNRKEQVIQTLQEKINNLQRRIVFLETELYEMQNTL